MGYLIAAEKEFMAKRHFNLVPYVVNKYVKMSIFTQEDLMGVGTEGLCKALNKYETTKGTLFSTYAYKCIRNEILYYMRTEGKINEKTISMSTILSKDKNGHALQLEDTISATEQAKDKSAEQMLLDNEVKASILRAISILGEKQQQVIIKIFGLDGNPPKTQIQVAQEIGMSQANVSKILYDTSDRLKYLLRRHSDEIYK